MATQDNVVVLDGEGKTRTFLVQRDSVPWFIEHWRADKGNDRRILESLFTEWVPETAAPAPWVTERTPFHFDGHDRVALLDLKRATIEVLPKQTDAKAYRHYLGILVDIENELVAREGR